MKIILLRHGKPVIPPFEPLKASELDRWITAYNSAGIDHAAPLSEATAVAAGCAAVVCSDLARSITSAEALNVKQVHHTDPLFREMGLPYAAWNFLRLPPIAWAALFRMLWFFGYCPNSESFADGRLRARDCARRLEGDAAEHGSVLFVGHGLLNYFIAKELLASGWQGPKHPGRKHWEFGVYTSTAECGAE